MISYKNKSNITPNVKDIIGLLIEKNIDFMLVGSQIGKYYGICEDPSDIDFLISNSFSNISKIFLMLKQFFNISDINEILRLDVLHLITKDKIPIQLFKYEINKDCNCLIASDEYNKLKKDSTIINFYGHNIHAINLQNYISCMMFVIKCLELNDNQRYGFTLTDKINKYKTIVNRYKNKYEHIYEPVDIA